MKQFNTILRLRRDNDYNYRAIGDKFIPANGEICLVDTSAQGLMAVCGDGVTPFNQLKFLNQLVTRGYFIENNFYNDMGQEEECLKLINVIYLDLKTSKLYYYNGEEFLPVQYHNASATEAGIMKLYDSTGYNADGTMTQKAITNELDAINDELDDKFEIALNIDEEMIIFTQE